MADNDPRIPPDLIRTLLQNKPYLAPYFQDEPKSASYRLSPAKKGGESLQGLINGDWKSLSSTYDPQKEALRMLPADHTTWNGREVVVVLGLGNPHILETLAPFLKPGQIAIIVESSRDCATFLMQHSPNLFHFLYQPGRHLFSGDKDIELLKSYLESIPQDRLTGIRILSHSPSRNLAPLFYEQAEELIKKIIQSKMSDLLTRFEFEKLWIRNIIQNSIFFPQQAATSSRDRKNIVDVSLLSHFLEGTAAILISAGPSLKESLPWIKKFQDRLFLLSTDTALKVLLRAQIVPDAVYTLDAQIHSMHHYLGENIQDVLFIGDIVVHPRVIRQVTTNAKLFSTTEKYIYDASGKSRRQTTPGTEYIENLYGPIGGIQSGGSVATSAYDLLRHMGASTILLVGQDLAYTGRKIHSSGTHHNERWLTKLSRVQSLENINEAVIRKRQTFFVSSVNEGQILTDYVLNMYRGWFEDALATSKIPTWNCSANGAKIQGSYRPKNIEEEIEKLVAKTKKPDLRSILSFEKRPPQVHEKNHKLLAMLSETLNHRRNTEFFLEQFPEISRISLRAGIYVSRNREKLGEDRSREVYEARVKEDLEFLYKGLKKDPAFYSSMGNSKQTGNSNDPANPK